MDKVPLNNSPDLSMEQITKLLFNNKFMSDIQFHIEGKVIYAHSWEVMKRSVVFRHQFLTNLGENKLIPIEDVTYKAFYQFVRFIYTDECDIEERLICDMLKLAVRYKIVKLETKVLNMPYKSNDPDLELLEFGVLNKYDLYINTGKQNSLQSLCKEDTVGSTFLNIHSNVLENILKFDIAFLKMKEVDLFDGLVRWMNKSCEQNQIPLAQRRSHFDKLIRLIRFPAMASDDFRLCLKTHPDLLTNDDIGTIMRQSVVTGSNDASRTWNTKPRLKYQIPWMLKENLNFRKQCLAKFTVSENLTLLGLRYGTIMECNFKKYQILVSSRNLSSNITDKLRFEFDRSRLVIGTICLGDSILLAPNIEYSIGFIMMGDYEGSKIYCRKPNIDVVVSGPSLSIVTFREINKNLFEIFFNKSPAK